MSPIRLAIVVLAGGEGRRMEGAKPMRLLAGRTLLERAMQWACSRSWDVAVSARSMDQLTPFEEAPVLLDDPAIPGPLAGIASAMAFAAGRGATSVLTIPCDAPFLPDDLAERLAAALADGKGVALASSGGRLHPVCALWRTGLDPALKTYAATGRGALMGLADSIGWTAVDWPVEPLDPFFNINTPEDLQRAAQLLSASAHPREGGDPGVLSEGSASPGKKPGSPPSRG